MAGRIENGPGLKRATLERLACGARVRTVRERRRPDGSRQVPDVGRSRRLATAAQYQALVLRDGPCCGYPGCGNTRLLQAHHVVHWLHGGPTDVANMVLLLCSRHHHAHHDGAFAITVDERGGRTFRRSDGRTLDRAVCLAAGLPVQFEPDDTDVAADAARSRWDGTRLDHHYAINVLAMRRDKARATAFS